LNVYHWKGRRLIVNDKHKFIFVHIPKNAGTSIRRALQKFPGNEPALVSGKTKHETWQEFQARWPNRSGRSHAELQEFCVIAVVRNPWERFVSLHQYLRERHQATYPLVAPTANGFAQQVAEDSPWVRRIHSLKPQTRFVEGTPHPATICRFETIADDIETTMAGLKLSQLEHLNGSGKEHVRWKTLLGLNTKEPQYRKVLDATSMQIVATKFSEDIARFGYRF
jgi:hypothetical protein